MAKKATITRIRTLYAIFIGVIALCIALFFLNVFTSADPIEVANLGENKSDYGMLITDLQSGPKLYQQNFDVDGLPEGLSANAKVSRYDIGIVADDMKRTSPGSPGPVCL